MANILKSIASKSAEHEFHTPIPKDYKIVVDTTKSHAPTLLATHVPITVSAKVAETGAKVTTKDFDLNILAPTVVNPPAIDTSTVPQSWQVGKAITPTEGYDGFVITKPS